MAKDTRNSLKETYLGLGKVDGEYSPHAMATVVASQQPTVWWQTARSLLLPPSRQGSTGHQETAMEKMKAPFFPIIYVRGYAMTRGEMDETTADPFCGFNLGSTVMRAVPERNRPPRKFVFESPVVRLGSDFGYSDVYEDGYDILDPEWSDPAAGNLLGARSIIIYRYYDPASALLGIGKTPTMEAFGKGLSELILKVRDLACANPANGITKSTFRCYLVAHSMGGLVCRTFLQNPKCGSDEARRAVDKLFTYATPHNGIDVAGSNVPAFLSLNDISNFNRGTRMPEYLNLAKSLGRVDLLAESALAPRKVFCMVGTNRSDYEAAAGLSRTFVGNGSDGLVRIENATLSGLRGKTVGEECAKAFCYRSHSGFFGIVNSEEAYQNLTRFLFGDVRVDIWLDIADLRLPKAVQDAAGGRPVNALYQIELLAAPRGKLWYLTRRTAEEDSAACVTHATWKSKPKHYLSSVFLANYARVNPRRRTLAYSLTLGVRVPDYEIEKRLWPNEHYEGSYLFRNTVIIELQPPRSAAETWKVAYAWQGTGVNSVSSELAPEQLKNGYVQVALPIDSDRDGKITDPAIKGTLRFVVSGWNDGGDWSNV